MPHIWRLLGVLTFVVVLPFYTDPLQYRLKEIISFVEAETGYKAQGRPVRVTFDTAENVNRSFFGKNYVKQETTKAYYQLGRSTIVLADWFRLGKNDDILVHEVTHWLQDINRVFFPCRNRMEAQAYQVQSAFIRRFGIWEPKQSAQPFEQAHRVCSWEVIKFNLETFESILSSKLAPVSDSPAPTKKDQYADIDPKIKEWFDSLENETGTPCCDEADGETLEQDEVEYDTEGSRYIVRIRGKWYVVEDRALLKVPNLMGKAMVWYVWRENAGPWIFCFIPGAQS